MIEPSLDVKWTDVAMEQVVDIYGYLKMKAGLKVADGAYEEIIKAVDNLSIFPDMGVKNKRLKARCFTMRLPYYIYYDYDLTKQEIRVISVLHQKNK